MRKIKNENVIKLYKTQYWFAFISLIILSVALVLFYKGYEVDQNTKGERNLLSIVNDVKNKKGISNYYAYLETNSIPQGIAEKNNMSYYLVYENNLFYVITATESYMRSLNLSDYIENEDDLTLTKEFRYTGYTKKIDNELRNYLINFFNEELEEEYLTKENFSDYISETYLVVSNDVSFLGSNYYAFSSIFGVTGLIMLLYFLVVRIRLILSINKFTEEEIEKINNSSDSTYFKGIDILAFEDSFIPFNRKIKFFEYEEVSWVYTLNSASVKYLYVIDNKGKVIYIKEAILVATQVAQNDFMDFISSKNKDVVVGYDKDIARKMKRKFKKVNMK